MSLEIPLGEQEHLKEFFELAEQHFKDERLKSYEKLIQYIDSMERQCADMREEIGYLKEQLQDMGNSSLKGKMEVLHDDLQKQIFLMGMKTEKIKVGISEQARNLLMGIRRGKNYVLEQFLNGLQVKGYLETTRERLGYFNQTLETGLKELERAGIKEAEAKAHKKEAIAVLRGKKIKDEKQEGSAGKEGILQRTLIYMKRLCEGMEQRTIKMIQVIEKGSTLRPDKPQIDWKAKVRPKTGEERGR